MSAPPGYALSLSRKTGERVVFCLDDSVAAGTRLPVTAIGGEAVGEVLIGPHEDGRVAPTEPWREGFRLPPRGAYEIDASLASGVYLLAGKIPFVHRLKHRAPLAVLLPSNTAAAFNPAGGRRFYETDGEPPADVVSFERPLPLGLLLANCRPFVQWLMSENVLGHETTYLIDSDLECADALDGVEVLIVIGRSEYWSRPMRAHFDAFVDRGGRALLLCSEVMFWQVRLDLQRQLMYRYSRDDPHPDPLLRTTVWRDPALRYLVYPRTGGERWHGGLNVEHEGVGWRGMRIVCPDSPLLSASELAFGDVVALPDAVNWDGAPADLGPEGVPWVDFGDSPPWRHEVVGYNLVKSTAPGSEPDVPAISLWTVLRRSPHAGTVIHGGTMGWCGPRAIGPNGPDDNLARRLILSMLDVLLENAWPFSQPPDEGV